MENKPSTVPDAFSSPSVLSDDSPARVTIIGCTMGVVTALVGGYLCGLMINQFGSIGAISLWALGFAAGFLASKLTGRRSIALATSLIVGCIVAYVVAEVLWIQWNIKGAETLALAISKFPRFMVEYQIDAFIAAVFTFFGAHAAYRLTAVRI